MENIKNTKGVISLKTIVLLMITVIILSMGIIISINIYNETKSVPMPMTKLMFCNDLGYEYIETIKKGFDTYYYCYNDIITDITELNYNHYMLWGKSECKELGMIFYSRFEECY